MVEELIVIKNFGKVALFALVAVATGCSSNGSTGSDQGAVGNGDVAGDRELGGVDFAFTAVPGLDISSISYDVVDATTSVSVRTGTADVSNADAQAKAFVLLPPGSYIANLTATGTLPCVGQTATFVVTSGGSITVSAALTCGAGATIQKGSAVINATFNPSNSCGITEMFVGPLTQGNGSNITMIGEATPNAAFAWTSSNPAVGVLSNANAATASLTCNPLGGTTTLTLTITDTNDIDCTDVQTVDVTCVPGGLCLNGTLNAPEQCDDGNTSDLDACTNSCLLNVCGDALLNTGVEACDDGNTSNLDACTNTCAANVCGDGFVNTGVEQCDDGATGSATCTASCTTIGPACGDGIVNGSDVCDDGDILNTTTACNATCTGPVVCGNGVVEAPVEACDDGDTSNSTTACDSTCSGPVAAPAAACGPAAAPGSAGATCVAANCAADLAACQGNANCVAVQTCLYDVSAGPACVNTNALTASFLDACYCGIGVDINNCYLSGQPATGACRVAINTAAATGPNAGQTLSQLQVAQTFYDSAYDMGLVGLLAYCQKTSCATECGF
jgi:cysteine-rich repeat protein